MLTNSPGSYGNFQSLFFEIGGTIYELTADAQFWRRELNSLIKTLEHIQGLGWTLSAA